MNEARIDLYIKAERERELNLIRPDFESLFIPKGELNIHTFKRKTCVCGDILPNMGQIRNHWGRGHFDETGPEEKEKKIKMIRPDFKQALIIPGMTICECGEVLNSINMASEHHSLGHFDYEEPEEKEIVNHKMKWECRCEKCGHVNDWPKQGGKEVEEVVRYEYRDAYFSVNDIDRDIQALDRMGNEGWRIHKSMEKNGGFIFIMERICQDGGTG